MTHAELYESIALVKLVLRGNPDQKEFTLTIPRPLALAWLDFLQHMDPDMPPAPICKALGPLVGDVVMNTKLRRIDDIANSLGPIVWRLVMIVDQLERRA